MEWLVVVFGECLAGSQAPLIVTKARHDGAASRRSRSVPQSMHRGMSGAQPLLGRAATGAAPRDPGPRPLLPTVGDRTHVRTHCRTHYRDRSRLRAFCESGLLNT